MNDTKADLNVISSLQLSDKLSTVILGHVDGNFKTHDMNGDSFVDEPALLQFDVASRWLYYTPETMIHWGVKAVKDSREGGVCEEDNILITTAEITDFKRVVVS